MTFCLFWSSKKLKIANQPISAEFLGSPEKNRRKIGFAAPTLTVILHRIGRFLATLARFCAQQGTTNEFILKFNRKFSSLTAQFRGKNKTKNQNSKLGVPGDIFGYPKHSQNSKNVLCCLSSFFFYKTSFPQYPQTSSPVSCHWTGARQVHKHTTYYLVFLQVRIENYYIQIENY